jgi:hypothetical protein
MMSPLISAIAARLTDSPTRRYCADGRVYKPDNLSDNESRVDSRFVYPIRHAHHKRDDHAADEDVLRAP